MLVCTPAGYGKTTLMSEWAAVHAANVPAAILPGEKKARFAWLSLEVADNDLARFFAYLSAALDRAAPGTRALIKDLLAAPQPPAPAELAAALVNPLDSCPESLVIVLDDTLIFVNVEEP